jgi:hypothetical protein
MIVLNIESLKIRIMKRLIFTMVLFTAVSCAKDEKEELRSKLTGTWYGTNYENTNHLRPEADHTFHLIYSIGFAYANGLEVIEDGTLQGLVARLDDDLNPISWSDLYTGTWELLDANEVRFNTEIYEIITLTEEVLILEYQYSDTVVTLTLERQ